MSFADLILAAALLTGSGPAELQTPAAVQATFPSMRFALLSLSLEWEILDPRETRYVLTRADDLASDLKMLQRRYQDVKVMMHHAAMNPNPAAKLYGAARFGQPILDMFL